MPTTYTPDPTATQTPAAQPDPDDLPLQSLPNSGEGCTAASIAQALKVVGDNVAWLKAPRAKASNWEQAIRRYRTARLITREGVDHFGFRNGNITEWNEDWTDQGQFTASASGTPTEVNVGRWILHCDPTTSIISLGPRWTSANNPGNRFLSLTTSTATARVDARIAAPFQTAVFNDDMAIALWWSSAIAPLPNAGCTFSMGFTCSGEPFPTANGAYFEKAPSDANWQANCIGLDVAATKVDTGIGAATGTLNTMGIVLLGANQSDDGTARALFFINGLLVANIATNLPYVGASVGGSALTITPIFAVNTVSVASVASLLIGPARYRQNLFSGDALV